MPEYVHEGVVSVCCMCACVVSLPRVQPIALSGLHRTHGDGERVPATRDREPRQVCVRCPVCPVPGGDAGADGHPHRTNHAMHKTIARFYLSVFGQHTVRIWGNRAHPLLTDYCLIYSEIRPKTHMSRRQTALGCAVGGGGWGTVVLTVESLRLLLLGLRRQSIPED